MYVITDTKKDLVSITGITESQRDLIISFDWECKLNGHWRQGKDWTLSELTWELVCWLTIKLAGYIVDAEKILDCLDAATETRIKY